MLTGDQNLLDIAYSVRWNIRTPELYLFELAQPDDTIREVAESAMRATVSRVSLNDAMGDKRADIEMQVAETMQRILDGYHSGVQVQGIAIKQADPPAAVNDAFKEVTAAQQQAQILHQPGERLRAPADRQGAGRGDRIRQGLRAVQAGARGHPPAHVLRNDGAGPVQGRQDDHRSAGRHSLSAAAAGAEAAQPQERQQ